MPAVGAGDENGSTLYGRIARLTITLPSGSFSDTDATQNTLVIFGGDDPKNPGLRITFKISKNTQKEPNTGEISVYNLAPTTRAKMQQKGTRVVLEAGYAEAGLDPLFLGDTRTTDHLREGPDWRTVMKCGDGERSFRYARISASFAGGVTVGDVVRACVAASGLSLGNTAMQATRLSKILYQGWSVHATVSSELDRILRSVGYASSVQDGVVQILAPNQSVAQTVPVLDSTSGLIGSPEMGTPEQKGKPSLLKFRSLLMAQGRPGGRINLRSERYNGIFRTRKVEHSGDTRGGDWFSDFQSINDPTASVA